MENKLVRITKKAAVAAGGNVWKKHGYNRVYLNAQACKKLLNKESYTAYEERELYRARTYLDVDRKQISSNKEGVRALFDRANIPCTR